MGTNVVTTGDITYRTLGYVRGKMLKRGQYGLTIARFSQSEEIPKNNTKTIRFRRYESLPPVVAPLQEAVPPPPGDLTYTDVEMTLEQYGYFLPLSDVVLDTHEDKLLKETSILCGEQIKESCERIDIATARGGTTVAYAGNVTGRSLVNSPPLRGDLRKIYRFLKKYRAEEISNILGASVKIATQPVDAAFFVLHSTDLDADVRNIEGFIPVKSYGEPSKALPHEIGSVDQFRFIATQLFEPWVQAGAAGQVYLSGGDAVTVDTACDVYPMLVFAKDAFATTKLQGENTITPYVVNPKAHVGNELAQRGFVAWKLYRANGILQQSWLFRYEVAATANPSW